MNVDPEANALSASLLLQEEQISISRRRVEGDAVRVSTVTNSVDAEVAEELLHERIEIEHIAIGRQVAVAPPVRVEGNVTILSVVEEILVVEKRLVLKEEVHIRRVPVTNVHRETVALRKQDVIVERTSPGASHRALPEELAPIPRQQELKE